MAKRIIQVYRFNTGSCGGCDLEIIAAVGDAADIAWATTPHEADVLLITGPLTNSAKAALVALMQELADRAPRLAVGRCAIDGHPLGRGGFATAPGLTMHASLDGCPPDQARIIEAIRDVARHNDNDG
jgi:Ni,Fe-hydrogenase III small subunit